MTASPPARDENLGWLRGLWERGWLKGWLLALAVVFAYLPALRGQFLWDDDSWTTKLSGLLRSGAGLGLIWSQPTAMQQYYPLTGTTFWLDYHLWGMRPLPYHVENVLLHALAALLFWRLLQRLCVPGAWLAAAVFALHPVMVESAGWISERKNVLSLVFYLGALLAYGRFTRFWTQDHRPAKPDWSAYVLALALFLCALLAKTTAFSLPAVILLISWWRRGRIRWRKDVLPTLPFFALSLGLSAVTAWLEKTHVGAQGPDFALTFPERCLVAGHAFWFYIGKLVWPSDLCFVYPRWQLAAGSGWAWLYPVTAAGTLLGLWLARAKIGRGPAAAAFFFVGTLFPVLGFMNAYFMRYSFVCDHWVYLSSLGFIALLGAAVVRVAGRLGQPVAAYGFAAVVLPVLAVATWWQAGMYADSETLWRTTVTRNPDAWMAYDNLGSVLLQSGRVDKAIGQYEKALEIHPRDEVAYNDLGMTLFLSGRVDEAIVQYQRALEIKPDYDGACNNLGNALAQKGQVDEAIAQYQRALAIQPKNAVIHCNLGHILVRTGRLDEAIAHFQSAVEIQPLDAVAYHDLGQALFQSGRVDEAIARYQSALKIKPDYTSAYNNLGNALVQKGRLDEAITQYQKALAIEPQNDAIHCNLGDIFLQKGQMREAMEQFQKVLQIRPASIEALNNLAWVLATCPETSIRNGARAVALAEQANQLSQWTNPAVVDTLAAAYAEAGRFPEAIKTAQQAQQLAAAQNKAEMAEAIRMQIELYQAGPSFRGMGQTNPPARSQ